LKCRSIFLALFFSTASAQAQLWGPKDYQDCILKNMKGVTSDVAARAIANSCFQKFPVATKPKCKTRKLRFWEIHFLTGSASIFFANGAWFDARIYNGAERVLVQELTFEISAENIKPGQRYKWSSEIPPLTTASVSFPVEKMPTKDFSWKILDGLVCDTQ
jgi:hypothetical protein